MIFEQQYSLTEDERHTLLFLTGGLRVFKHSDVSKAEMNNIYTFFDIKKETLKILKVIIKRDCTILKFVTRKGR